MIKEIDVALSAKEAYEETNHINILSKLLEIPENKISFHRIIKRSIDARRRNIVINLRFLVGIEEKITEDIENPLIYRNVKSNKEVLIIGAGPAGLFAALQLISLGLKPVIFERGKEVSLRKKDIASIFKTHQINPDSNYAFGEGGAGAFSDGKLYTRSKKRGNIEEVLRILYHHGASENILYDHQPHIGSDKLPQIIKNIRNTILDCGGEIIFNSKIIDFVIENNKIKGIVNQSNEIINGDLLILSAGHSAGDIYKLLDKKNIPVLFKPFAMGIRIEHPQELINQIQYHSMDLEYLPPASYNLVCQARNRGVYSFCMCPGGVIVPSATSNEEMVTNGMSSSKRMTPYANSGIVVEIQKEDTKFFSNAGVFSGFEFQKNLEKIARRNGGGGLIAPAQRLGDFVRKRLSSSLPETSYIPGIISSPVHSWLPEHISIRLIEGIKHFENMMKGFITNDAIVTGVESRTSSTLRIPRNDHDYQHPSIQGLFPCGEGAGYSGGIVSSALDGMNCSKKIVEFLMQ